ncbi:MAG TPA: hypothetical protein VFN61_07760 [Acidimicrobiales bacterium]|nr:hypothetical protein [Acidimicrobiales bacterium]
MKQRGTWRGWLLAAAVTAATVSWLAGSAPQSRSAFRTIGSIALTSDAQGAALFPGTSLVPGRPVTACAQVQTSATQGEVYMGLQEATGNLLSYLQVVVSVGTGGTFGNCSQFQGAAIYSGSLAGLEQPAANGATGVDTGWSPSPTLPQRSFEVTVTVADSNAAESAQANGIFVWTLVGQVAVAATTTTPAGALPTTTTVPTTSTGLVTSSRPSPTTTTASSGTSRVKPATTQGLGRTGTTTTTVPLGRATGGTTVPTAPPTTRPEPSGAPTGSRPSGARRPGTTAVTGSAGTRPTGPGSTGTGPAGGGPAGTGPAGGRPAGTGPAGGGPAGTGPAATTTTSRVATVPGSGSHGRGARSGHALPGKSVKPRSVLNRLIATGRRLAAQGRLPLTLLVVLAGFLFLQGRLDRRDPKLALAPMFAELSLRFDGSSRPNRPLLRPRSEHDDRGDP